MFSKCVQSDFHSVHTSTCIYIHVIVHLYSRAKNPVQARKHGLSSFSTSENSRVAGFRTGR